MGRYEVKNCLLPPPPAPHSLPPPLFLPCLFRVPLEIIIPDFSYLPARLYITYSGNPACSVHVKYVLQLRGKKNLSLSHLKVF